MRALYQAHGHELRVTDVMSKPVAVDASVAAHAALHLAMAGGAHDVVVVTAGQPVGVICTCDLENAPPDRSVARCLQGPAVCVGSDRSAMRAWQRMREHEKGTLPVTDEQGDLVGVVVRAKLREKLFGPEERGVDVCMSCRGTHHLRAPGGQGTPKFCADCLNRDRGVPLADGIYVTLGGSG